MKLVETQSRIPTLHFTSRCDARHLATLALMWQERGEIPRSTSELVRLSLETFVEILVQNGQTTFVPTQSQAQEILGSIGLLGKNILKRNLVEAITKEGNLSSLNSMHFTPVIREVAHDSPDLTLATRQLDEALSSPEEFLKRKLEKDRELKDLLSINPKEPENIN